MVYYVSCIHAHDDLVITLAPGELHGAQETNTLPPPKVCVTGQLLQRALPE